MAQPACHLPSQIILSVKVLLIDSYYLNIHCWITLLTAGEVWAAGFRTVCAAYIWLHLLPGTDGTRDLSDDFLCSPDNLPCSMYVIIHRPLSAVLKLKCLACVLEACLVFCSSVELMKSVKTGCTVGHTADTVELSIQYQAILLGYGKSPILALNLLPPLICQFPKKKKKSTPLTETE